MSTAIPDGTTRVIPAPRDLRSPLTVYSASGEAIGELMVHPDDFQVCFDPFVLESRRTISVPIKKQGEAPFHATLGKVRWNLKDAPQVVAAGVWMDIPLLQVAMVQEEAQ